MILKAEDCVKVDNDIYLICKDINIIYKINLKDNRISLIDSIPEENIATRRVCSKIVNWKDELFFIPFNSNKLWILNITTHIWRSIDIKEVSGVKEALFFQAVLFENHLFVIGSRYPAILDINLETGYINYISELYNKKTGKDILFRCDYVQKNECLYLASCLSNEILIFNMKTYEYNWIPIGKKDNRYTGIIWDGKYFWIAPRYHTPIVRWNGEDEIIEYKLPQKLETAEQGFIGIVLYQNCIILPAISPALSVMLPNCDPEAITIVDESYYFFRKIGTHEYIYMDIYGEIHIESGSIKKVINCQIEKEKIYFYYQNLKSNRIIFYNRLIDENDIVSLDFFVKNVEDIEKKTMNIENEIGKKFGMKL